MATGVSVEGWSYMKAKDAISGKEGALYATVYDEATGENVVRQVAECKNISATVTKNKSEFKALGYRGTQHKATGWTGTGSMTIYFASSNWVKQMLRYANDGIDEYFTLQLINQDPTSSIGVQKITLLDVNIDELEIAKLDVDSDFLDQSINFTFSDVNLDSSFKNLHDDNY